jgi:hypothetical protein
MQLEGLGYCSDKCSVFAPIDASTCEHCHLSGRCLVTSGRGAALSWRVEVEGQANAMPLASYAPPTLDRAYFAAEGVVRADTQGGTELALEGRNLWDDVRFVSVSITTPAGVSTATGCRFIVPHEKLVCTLPPGVGTISLVTLTELDQGVALGPVGLAYAAPAITSVAPVDWPTNVDGATLTVTGRGFGTPSISSLVAVTVSGVVCNASREGTYTNVSLKAGAITVRNDTQLTFEVRGVVEHVVSPWMVAISVAGRALDGGVWTIPSRPPTSLALSLARLSNGTHNFLRITGLDLGAGVGTGTSTCGGRDVTVTIDGVSCSTLVMTQVGGLVWQKRCYVKLVTARASMCSCLLKTTPSWSPWYIVGNRRLRCVGMQPHTQLLCVTQLDRGTLRVATVAGAAPAMLYDSSELQQPPSVTNVVPLVWSPSESTIVTVTGQR